MLVCSAASHLVIAASIKDSQVQQAREMMEQKKFISAISILKPLANEEDLSSSNTNILFLLGLSAIEASQLTKTDADRKALIDYAIMILSKILSAQPDLLRVRLELARAFFLKKEYALSLKNFKKVLANNPPLNIKDNILRFVNTINARYGWQGHLIFSIAPDSNIASASNESTIIINNLPFTLDGNNMQSGIGFNTQGEIRYKLPIADTRSLLLGASVFIRDYAGSEFDQAYILGDVGINWASQGMDINTLATAHQVWVDGQPYSYDLGSRFEYRQLFAKDTLIKAALSWQNRRHRSATHLDGQLFSTTSSISWRHSSDANMQTGLSYTYTKPKSIVWRNHSLAMNAGYSYRLDDDVNLGAQVATRWTKYRGNWRVFTGTGKSRSDFYYSASLSASHRALVMYDFIPKVSLIHEVRSSNASLYSYQRTRLELQFISLF